jgi:DNA-binding MarR family transcriptional regulator
MTELAERVQTSPSGMTRAIGRLGRAGVVERRQDPHDRRSFIVRLTALGEAKLRAAQVTHHACVRERLFGGLTDAEIARLRAIYDRAPAAPRPAYTSAWIAAS